MPDRTCACGADLTGLNRAVRECPACREKVMRAAGLEPLVPYPGSVHKPWKCRCMICGEEVKPQFANVQQRGAGCNPCARRQQAETRHLSEDEAVATMRAAGAEPLVPYTDSSTPWESRCMGCGTNIRPRHNDVQRGQGPCWECAKKATGDRCRIPQDEAVALARSVGLEPLEPYRSNGTPWPCRCTACGWRAPIRLSVLKRGAAGCGRCSGSVIDPEVAAATMRAAGFEPLEPYSRSDVRWPSRCLTCEHTVKPTYWSVRRGHGCRWCSAKKSGFKPGAPGMVYLVTHADYDAVKVGITNAKGSQLAKHLRRGWQDVMTVQVPGYIAEDVEDAILLWWRNELGLPIHLGPSEMPQGGWTETVAACEVDLAGTMAMIRKLAREAT